MRACSATPVTRIESIDDAIAQNKRICVWGAAADWELVSQQYPTANLRKSADHPGAIVDMAAVLCDAAVVPNNEWSVLPLRPKPSSRATAPCSMWAGVREDRPTGAVSSQSCAASESREGSLAAAESARACSGS